MEWIDLSQYLPVLLISIILIILGLSNLCFPSIISPTNFQQGTTEISIFCSAINCTFIVIAPLIFILPALSPEHAVHYLFGYACAAILTILLITPILHYNPSPSICYYIKLRFNQSFLYIFVCILNVIFLIIFTVMLHIMIVSIITPISLLSPYKTVTALGVITIFAILFGGQTTVSTNIFFGFTCLIISGILFITFDNFTNKIYDFIDNLLSGDYLSFDSWTAFYLGFLNGLYFLTTSPLLYQQYFSLSSCQRLRKSLSIHVGFLGLLFGTIVISPNLFINSINWFCQRKSFSNFNTSQEYLLEEEINNDLLSFLITSSTSLIISFAIILTQLALINLIWEDLLRPLLMQWPIKQQIRSMQIGLIIVGGIIIAISNVWLHFNKPITYGPISFTLAAPLTALYICSYIIPFLTGKGAITGLIIGLIGASALFYLYFYVTPFRVNHFFRPCLNGTLMIHPLTSFNYKIKFLELNFIPISLQPIIVKIQQIMNILCEIPIAWYPLTTFLITILSMLLVSLCTIRNNDNKFDCKLIIYLSLKGLFSCYHYNTTGNHKHVAFVECESFRYAQQTPYPDTITRATSINRQ